MAVGEERFLCRWNYQAGKMTPGATKGQPWNWRSCLITKIEKMVYFYQIAA
jgi:hypothetical protein